MLELTNEVNFWAVEAPGANVGGGGAGEKFDGKEGVAVDLVWVSVGAGVGALKVNAPELAAGEPKPTNPANFGLLGDCRK
jgi:hypothetical protein